MKQRLQQALVTAEVRQITTTTLSPVLDKHLHHLKLPPDHRLHLLVRSIAWHQKRQTPAERLQELASELARLWHAVENQQERDLYLFLLHSLGLRDELQGILTTLQEDIQRLNTQIHALDRKQKTANTHEEVRSYRKTMRQQQRLQAVQVTERTLYQQVLDALPRASAAPQQEQCSWAEKVVSAMHVGQRQFNRTYALTGDEIAALKPQIRLLLALAAVQLIQTARQRKTVWEMIAGQAKEQAG